MNIRNKLNRSFILLCLWYFLLYSISLAIIYFGFSYYTNTKLNNAFPSTEAIIKYEKYLETDSFADIPPKINHNCSYIIFDEDGQVLYANNQSISNEISFNSVQFINEYMGDFSFYVSENINNDSSTSYTVYKKAFDNMGNEYVISKCTLDSEYNIIDGELFSNYKQLTQTEFDMLNGVFSNNLEIEKLEYNTVDGEKRVLVIAYPIVSDEEYDALMQRVQRIWLLAIPIILIVILFQTFLFAKKIKESIFHINTAIDSYKENEKLEVDKSKIPNEFHSTVDNFNALLNSINNLQQEKEMAYNKNKQIIADISHDLKTPLTVIQGYANAIIEGKIPDDKIDKYLEILYEKSVLSTQLIDSLFEYVKMEHPNYQLDLTDVDLCEFVKEILAEKYNEIEESGFDLEINIPETKIFFQVDKKLFKRLFENLVGNCLKYNPKNTIIFVALKATDTEIILTVADNGVGISADISEKVFNPFVTSNEARSSGKGTGLGLTISKRIVELHKGTIELAIDKNKLYNTEFIIKFKRH